MKDEILTEEELEMLRNLTMTSSSSTVTIDILSPEFRALLFKAIKIRLEIRFTQHYLSFPVDAKLFAQLSSLPLGIPDIYEFSTTSRLWRLPTPKSLTLMDNNNIPLPFEIRNISTQGMFISSNQDILTINQIFRAILKIEEEKIKIEGTVIRRQLKVDKGFEWAIALKLSPKAYAKLQSYIYEALNDRIYESDDDFEI